MFEFGTLNLAASLLKEEYPLQDVVLLASHLIIAGGEDESIDELAALSVTDESAELADKLRTVLERKNIPIPNWVDSSQNIISYLLWLVIVGRESPENVSRLIHFLVCRYPAEWNHQELREILPGLSHLEYFYLLSEGENLDYPIDNQGYIAAAQDFCNKYPPPVQEQFLQNPPQKIFHS